MVDIHCVWLKAWHELGCEPPASLYLELVELYSEPSRAYHTVQHLKECFNHFEPVRHFTVHPAEVELAIWFHDAIYDTTLGDSEERSAQLAATHLQAAGIPADSSARVRDLVLATKHVHTPTELDGQFLVDTDLSILGAPASRYHEYELQVRQEYCWVGDATFQRERSRILQRFLDRPRIYATEHFFQLLENQARINLRGSVKKLLT